MDGNEVKFKRQSSYSEGGNVPQEQRAMIETYGKDWKIKDILEVLRKDLESMNSGGEQNSGESSAVKTWDSEPVRRTLSRISSELLSRSPSEDLSFAREIKDLEHSYKSVMEMFLWKTEKFLQSVRELREDLKKTMRLFRDISRWSARVTLASSLTEFSLLTFNALHRVFRVEWNPKIFFFATLVQSLSITASLFALSYMKQSTMEISRDVRDDNLLFMDMMVVHRRGNWIDGEIFKFFPHGIDLNCIPEQQSFQDKHDWRIYLCSVVTLTNIRKDWTLLRDETFLARVKAFVESQAAEFWWHRIKIKKLLKEMMEKIDTISKKEIVADYEIYYRRTALHLYPILIPWLLNSWHSTGMRLFFSSIAAILAYNDLSDNEIKEFEKLKKISVKFGKNFEEIKEICNTLDNDYDG